MKNMLRVIRSLVFLFLASLAFSASGQATRTWVSGVGDDANPCSRTAPCKTFAGAISKTAAGGEINALDPGGFGAVTITKSITIDGGGFIAGVLASGTNGIVVNAAATDVVVLRGLDINGVGTGLNGVRFIAGKELHIENCVIYSFTQKGVDAQSSSAGHTVTVKDSIIRNNANSANGGGIFVKPAGGATGSLLVDNSLLSSNKFGVRIEDANTSAVIRNSSAVDSPNGSGFVALNSAQMSIDSSTASGNNTAGVNSQNSAVIYLSNSVMTRNNPGIYVSGGSVISFGNNRNQGNIANGAPTSTVGMQ